MLRATRIVSRATPMGGVAGCAIMAIVTAKCLIAGADQIDFVPSPQTARAEIVTLDDHPVTITLWTEEGKAGIQPHYAISLDGRTVDRVTATSYDVKLRYATFDPVVAVPPIMPQLTATTPESGDVEGAYIVQFVTQPLAVYRADLEAMGVRIHKFLAHHAYIVRMTADAAAQVESLDFVRWVGPFHPAYKLEEWIGPALATGDLEDEAIRYNVLVHDRGLVDQDDVARRIGELGGVVHMKTPQGFRMEATLTGAQLREIAHMPAVAFIDRWTERSTDMDVVREVGGADYLESVAGYTGDGVRGEVMDTNLFTAHQDFQAIPPLIHGNTAGSASHGTASYGCVFGDGTGFADARGVIPDAQGIFADYGQLNNRYTHTAQLLNSPYFAVFQSNSWGNSQTTSYNSISTEMDDILFINDILILNSQSNTGNQNSRPQAWAKNIVSVGAVNHQGTVNLNDDCWCGDASIGPAADGRIKPDLCFFNDGIGTTADGGGYTSFGGTSAATPETAGFFGLFFQMWSDGIFGNPVDPGGTVFENRPHMSTAKAMMINNAASYPFTSPTADLRRTHQGWGRPDVQRMYDFRERISVLIDETDVLSNLQSMTYEVAASESELRATLVYTDPAGTTSSSQHRINDLTLKVTAPDGTIYYGNNGLLDGNWSTPGGSPNDKDTVENVFIQSTDPGLWTIEVIAEEINEDAHTETPQMDADYALVVTLSAPTNDECATAPLLVDGDYLVANGGSSTSSPDETGGDCTDFSNDVWYRYAALCDGTLTIDLCDVTFDAQVAVYSECPDGPDQAIICGNDSCGQGVSLTFDAPAGLYNIRVGGVDGAEGMGTLSLSCEADPCVADCAGSDGQVDVIDLLDLLAQWGGPGSCDLTGDGQITVADLLELLGNWGTCP